MFCKHLLALTRFVMLLRRRSCSGAAERREGVRRGPSKNVRPLINQFYKARWGPEFLSVLFFFFCPDQINFLNSVIVDLQRKNEDLKIKLKKLALAEFNGNDENDG